MLKGGGLCGALWLAAAICLATLTGCFEKNQAPPASPPAAPPPVTPAVGVTPPAGTATPPSAAPLVDLTARNSCTTAWPHWPVSGGVPLPKSRVKDVTRLRIAGQLAQFRVLSRWSDDSIKWVLVDALPPTPAQSTIALPLQLAPTSETAAPLPTRPNRVVETAENIVVETGRLRMQVNKQQFRYIEALDVDLNGDGRFGAEERVVAADGPPVLWAETDLDPPQQPAFKYQVHNDLIGSTRPFEQSPSEPYLRGGPIWLRTSQTARTRRWSPGDRNYSARVVEQGPLKTVVEMRGELNAQDGANLGVFHLWITAWNEQPQLQVDFTFVFQGDAQKDFIRRFGLQLPLAALANDGAAEFLAPGAEGAVVQARTDATPAYLTCTGPSNVFHLEHESFLLPWQVQNGTSELARAPKVGGIGGATPGWIAVRNPRFTLTCALRDMARLYPKELAYDPTSRRLTTWFWPDHGNAVLDTRCSGWEQGMQGFAFSNRICYYLQPAGQPLQAASVAMQCDNPLRPYAQSEWYSFRGTQAAGMLAPVDEKAFPQTEAMLATRTAFIERSMTEFGWLGMLNYGDLMWAYHYNDRGRDVGTWGMDDRKDDYAGWRHGNSMVGTRMFNQYLRSGEDRYFAAAEAQIRCVRDVLIKHFSADHPEWCGFGRRHSAYFGCGKNYDRPGGAAMDGYGNNWLGLYLHWNLTGDWRTHEVMGEVRQGWLRWGNSIIHEVSGGAYVGLKLYASVPGFEAGAEESEKFRGMMVSRCEDPGDYWRDCTWFLALPQYFADVDDRPIKDAILRWWQKRAADEGATDGLYWIRDDVAAVYWAADRDPKVRAAAVQELREHGSVETRREKYLDAQTQLYRKYGRAGLWTCAMQELAPAIARSAYRAKDDIEQIEWDEPLGMAVLMHAQQPNAMPTAMTTTSGAQITASTQVMSPVAVATVQPTAAQQAARIRLQTDLVTRLSELDWGVECPTVNLLVKGEAAQVQVIGANRTAGLRVKRNGRTDDLSWSELQPGALGALILVATHNESDRAGDWLLVAVCQYLEGDDVQSALSLQHVEQLDPAQLPAYKGWTEALGPRPGH